MIREFLLFDALVPTLVPVFLLTGCLMLFLDRLFAATGLYSIVWYPSLFRAAAFAILFSGIGLLVY